MEERSHSPWVMWAVMAGTFALCCGLPIVALVAVAAGGTAAVLTGVLWLAFPSAAVAVVLAVVHFSRRRIRARISSFIPVQELAQTANPSESGLDETASISRHQTR